MIHLLMLVAALSLAWSLRRGWFPTLENWNDRWRQSLVAFLLPPLLLLTTALALICMGPKGQMVLWWEGWGSYGLAIGFVTAALILISKLAIAGWRSVRQVQQYQSIEVQGHCGRLIESPLPFIAQVGFWTPELVISQGLLKALDATHLEAVLVHEQAHFQHRDTFWFFWLGWLRRLTVWLPQTEALWQELLVLRELRADQFAAQTVDGLLLAEALLSVVSAPTLETEPGFAAFSATAVRDRLSERIEALLSEPLPEPVLPWWTWLWFGMGLLPLLVIPFHV